MISVPCSRTLFALVLVTAACAQQGTATAPPSATDPRDAFDEATVSASPPSTRSDRPVEGPEDPGLDELLPATPVTTAPPGAVRASIFERQEAKLSCLRRHGFDGEIAPDLGIVSDVSPDQQARFLEVNAVCREEVGRRSGMRFGAPTPEELIVAFRELLYTRACMLDQGYPVDTPPSLERYVESGGAIWHPYTAFVDAGASPTELQRLREICPDDSVYLRSVLDLGDRPER